MMRRIFKSNIVGQVILSACLVFAAGHPGFAQSPTDSGPAIRIAILREVSRVDLALNGAYEITDPLTEVTLDKGLRFHRQLITRGQRGIRVGAREYELGRVRFFARRDVSVFSEGKERRYRGVIDVLLGKDGKFTVINRLDLEDYVRGVLYHEISHRWTMEAIKVQAVATRSYAVYQMSVNAKKDYDVTSDIYSQVYGGRTGERYRTNLASQATRGQILTYEGKLFPAYFHATCGGHTENVKELWPRHAMPPLSGVRCRYCRESPHYFWKRNLRLQDISDKLNKRGVKVGLIEDIAVLERDASDRIKRVKITDRDKKSVVLPGKDFREYVGPNIIRSNNYFTLMQGYYVDFFGKGWGHGVGMCQWGAQGMSQEGFAYDKILQFYYPGTKIVIGGTVSR